MWVCVGLGCLAGAALIATGIGAAAGVGITTAIVGTYSTFAVVGAVAVVGGIGAAAGAIACGVRSNIAAAAAADLEEVHKDLEGVRQHLKNIKDQLDVSVMQFAESETLADSQKNLVEMDAIFPRIKASVNESLDKIIKELNILKEKAETLKEVGRNITIEKADSDSDGCF